MCQMSTMHGFFKPPVGFRIKKIHNTYIIEHSAFQSTETNLIYYWKFFMIIIRSQGAFYVTKTRVLLKLVKRLVAYCRLTPDHSRLSH